MSGAVDCLEFLPDDLVVEVSRGLGGCADDPVQCKRLLYHVLTKHYGHTQRPPLLSNHIFDIHSGISELLGKRRIYRICRQRAVTGCSCDCLHSRLFSQTFCVLSTVNGKREQAVEALQLCLKLQDSRSREELRRLLRFMSVAANPEEVKLHKEVGISVRLARVCTFVLLLR